MQSNIDALLSRMHHPELKLIDPGLERVERFLNLLGAPQLRLPPVIHVAGTNGKGSLIAYLHAIFEAAGYSVHRYISPHLVHFNERIVLYGKPVTDDYLHNLLQRVGRFVEQQPVTFFESTTAAAFLAFAEHPADILLLEVGMGGRLDATNVILNPLLTAITPVSIDHAEFLGDTIIKIAGEKAGIIKTNTPCVVGRQQPDAEDVISKKASSLHAPLYRMGHEWRVTGKDNNRLFQSSLRTVPLQPSLTGSHQFDNAATAVACVDLLQQFTISDEHIMKGLANADWPGRLQPLSQGKLAKLLSQGIELWLDGGHNPQGATVLAAWLKERGIPETYLICGMVKGKDTVSYLSALAPYVKELFAVNITDEPLSQSVQQILHAAGVAGIRASEGPNIEKSLQTIAERAKTPAIICICGSLYLTGKVLALNEPS